MQFFPFLPAVFWPRWGRVGGRGSWARPPGTIPACSIAGVRTGERAAASPFARDSLAGRRQDTQQHIAQCRPGGKVPIGCPSHGSLSRSGSLEPVGVWGWGLQAPSLPPQPCLAQRGHPGTAGASDGSPLGKQKGIKCLFRGRGVWSRCPPAAPMSPGAERVPGERRLQRRAAGKRLTCSSYSKHFVWGLGPRGAPHSREEAGIGGGWAVAGLSEGLGDGSLLHRQERAALLARNPRHPRDGTF